MAAKSEVRQVNVRLPVDLVEQVEAIVQVEELTDPTVSITGLFREALERLVEERRADPEFQAARERALEQHRLRLEALK